MHLNQSFDEILSLLISLFILFIFSIVISLLFLKINYKTEKKIYLKALLPNFVFFLISNILYQISINKRINISVFSRNEKLEILTIIITFTVALIVISIIEIYICKLVLKSELNKKYCYLLFVLNIFIYSYILFSYYPKPYVDKNILSYNRYLYQPNKTELRLFDNSIVKIDIACSSENIYKTSQINYDYVFRIPIKQIGTDRMLYSFIILDKTLDNGSSEEDKNCKTISINKLQNIIKVAFVQRNPNPNIGWKKPIVTDTIVFRKTKTENRKAGYYGDTNCDCIEN